jgi:hypothetical protein
MRVADKPKVRQRAVAESIKSFCADRWHKTQAHSARFNCPRRKPELVLMQSLYDLTVLIGMNQAFTLNTGLRPLPGVN